MNPKEISINDFTYSLPESRIAIFPLAERDQSKLLIYKESEIREDQFLNLDHYLPPGSRLFFNDTKVIEARIEFFKASGARIEIFCLEPTEGIGGISEKMKAGSPQIWNCLIGGASKWKPGLILEKTLQGPKNQFSLFARYAGKTEAGFGIEFSWTDDSVSFAEMLQLAGAIPLPPYLHRAAVPEDASRYQTVYANQPGSVAAPTAGLHFTPAVINKLTAKSIQSSFVTLHVGAGTFKPVKADKLEDHYMHSEFIDVSVSVIRDLANMPEEQLFCVGTTTLRTLESLYWLGVKAAEKILAEDQDIRVEQWEPYTLPDHYSKEKALNALAEWMETTSRPHLYAKTQILIAPGYRIRTVRGLVTNFHQPQSTLLLLVAAFIGPDWKKVYEYALDNDFRFLSYGDACLFFRN